jgi:hypothetical protein
LGLRAWALALLVLVPRVVHGEATRYVGVLHRHVAAHHTRAVFQDGESKLSNFKQKSQRVFTFHAELHEHAKAWHSNHSAHVMGVEPAHRHVAYGDVAPSAITGVCPRPTTRWGLDAADGSSDGSYSPACVNSSAHIFVLDTGISQHTEFGSRLGSSFCALTTEQCAANTPSWTDVIGHGTHCAGAAAGNVSGVFSNATLHAVKVLDDTGSGWTDHILMGMEWVLLRVMQYGERPAVVSMSLGCSDPCTSDLETAMVNELIAEDVVVVIAAGNEADNACSYSPGSTPAAVTVAAVDSMLAPASFSNYGACVDVNAPGVNIVSTWPGNAYATLSGTSMATPHVAGLAAMVRAFKPCLSAQTVHTLISSGAVIPSPYAGTTANMINATYAIAAAAATACPGAPPPQPPSPPYSSVMQCSMFQASGGSTVWCGIIPLARGQTYLFSTCGAGACSGDTVIVLYDSTRTNLLMYNDDLCGTCSGFYYTVPTSSAMAVSSYYLLQGCYGATDVCSGTVFISVIGAPPPPSPSPPLPTSPPPPLPPSPLPTPPSPEPPIPEPPSPEQPGPPLPPQPYPPTSPSPGAPSGAPTPCQCRPR